jgi:hypothetical protein
LRLPLKGLAASELRRMFLQLTLIRHPPTAAMGPRLGMVQSMYPGG